MAEYHVGFGFNGIYAGIINKKGDKWLRKSDVTIEAIDSVLGFMYQQIPEGKQSTAYAVQTGDGKYAILTAEVSDDCPEWAREQLEGKDKNG